MDEKLLWIVLSIVICFIILMVILYVFSITKLKRLKLEGEQSLAQAKKEAATILKQAVLEAKTNAHELKIEAEKEIKEKKADLEKVEDKLSRREDTLNMRDETLIQKERQLEKKIQNYSDKMDALDEREVVLNEKIASQDAIIESISQMTINEAREVLFEKAQQKVNRDIGVYIKEKEEEARSIANEKAKNIIALAIQAKAYDEVSEKTVSTVALPNDEMKGRIIGREGRNIRAFERATGVDLIIDDTPEVIVLSCFNPIRREIAKMTLENLMKDGRIQPGRIEETVLKMEKELNDHIMKVGEETIFNLRLGKMDRELIKLVGRLKYRYSYGQSALAHSIEVAEFAGIMAAELGMNQTLAKRAGLLHDIGKALDFEIDGTHMELGYKVCKKAGEHEIVLNGIMAHHGLEDCIDPISNLVCAADVMSAARPGARRETMESYVKRLEGLEKIATSFTGVHNAFAIQAGREIRVMVQPDIVDDSSAITIAREIRDRIESELTYPGNVKVNVIRELRAIEIAK